MRGHLRRRGKKGLWSIVVRDPLSGKSRWIATGTASRREAEQQLVRVLSDLSVLAERERTPTVAQWLEQWMEDRKPSLRPRSVDAYRLTVKRVSDLVGSRRLSEIGPADVQSMVRRGMAGGLSAHQAAYMLRVFRTACRAALRLEVVVRDPTAAVRGPRVESRSASFLTREQASAFLSAAETHRLHALWTSAVTTGLRRGELLGVRWEDIDLDDATLSVRQQLGKHGEAVPVKSKAGVRTVALTPAAVAHLLRWQQEQSAERVAVGPAYDAVLVFPTGFGQPMLPRSLNHQFARLLKRAGLPHVRLHDLRHTFAALMIEAGVDPKTLQTAMGHSSIRVTLDLYGHLYSNAQRLGAVALDRLLNAPASNSVSKTGEEKGEMAK